jgi:rfaE bifunctional protein nucleotidyltransferase chain/domain
MPDGFGDDVARHLLDAWSARAVCVTAGGSGVWLATTAGEPVHVPTTPADGDPCGAGDAFAAAASTALAAGRTVSESVVDAVAEARGWVVAGGTSGFRSAAVQASGRKPSPPVSASTPGRSAEDFVRSVKEAGGTVVATGGCFDILHAGHLSCLQAARRLGDALVVLVNSDASVRRLKGAGRPVQTAQDRARVLLGLSCVDAVAVFDEDSPSSALARLRPDIWVKGGDYEGADLPEAAQVRGWGGRVVLLPYLSGYSTTAILAEVQ